jgi:hypothetical protein
MVGCCKIMYLESDYKEYINLKREWANYEAELELIAIKKKE